MVSVPTIRSRPYRVDLITQDGEPQPVHRPYAYFKSVQDAQDWICEYLSDTDLDGAYLALYDRTIEQYVDAPVTTPARPNVSFKNGSL